MPGRPPRLPLLAALAATVLVSGGCAGTAPRSGDDAEGTGQTLRPFRSEREFTDFYRRLAREQQRRMEAMPVPVAVPMPSPVPAPAPSTPSAPSAAPSVATSNLTVTGAAADESVTNVQHAGVDEGGIVKTHGDHLVVLRRGRLFTVRIGDGDLRPVSAVDAFAPGIDPQGAWYDEMLLAGDQVVVIGYSYRRGGTEVGLFHIAADGTLTHRNTYHLRSNDYYSSRNYASRLVGGKLVFYTPFRLDIDDDDEGAGPVLPALRRWREGVTDDDWQPVVSPTRIFRPARDLDPDDVALHTVTVCDLPDGEMRCEATAVIGPESREFYVSPQSVYVWMAEWDEPEEDDRAPVRPGLVVRMPLSGAAPSALGVLGSPVDQFSFLESDDRHLNVLVRAEGGGGMWGAEHTTGGVALFRTPISAFGDGRRSAPATAYRPLPRPAEYTFQNRYVGGHLLYGTGSGWGRPQRRDSAVLYAVPWRGGEMAALRLRHGVDRIEAMGGDAVVVGSDGSDLHFSAVALGGAPAHGGTYVFPAASQGETRSHGFFYRPEGERTGMLGLPVRGGSRPGYEQLRHGSAAILFLRNDALRFRELGRLDSGAERVVDDGCRASCVDWYGNARPLFLRGRVFALMGYELVEGSVTDGRIREVRRVSFAPRAAVASEK